MWSRIRFVRGVWSVTSGRQHIYQMNIDWWLNCLDLNEAWHHCIVSNVTLAVDSTSLPSGLHCTNGSLHNVSYRVTVRILKRGISFKKTKVFLECFVPFLKFIFSKKYLPSAFSEKLPLWNNGPGESSATSVCHLPVPLLRRRGFKDTSQGSWRQARLCWCDIKNQKAFCSTRRSHHVDFDILTWVRRGTDVCVCVIPLSELGMGRGTVYIPLGYCYHNP